MPGVTLEELAAKFRGPAQRVSGGVLVFCPSHEDRANRSLSLSTGDDGRLLVNCFAGCQSEKVLAAVGMSFKDLAAPAQSNGHGTGAIVATYDYTDGAGVLLYQVVRFEPKRFVQRRPDGRGGWIWSLGAVRRVPYRMPELVEQARVFWCEGEKDADRVASLGLPATTGAGGANAFRDDYAQQLAALGVREVVILPDNDPPGQAYAAAVARGCAAAGLEARILSLPGLAPKGDVSDWLNAGHTREELEALIAGGAAPAAGEPTPPGADPLGMGLGDFLALEFPDAPPLIEGLVTEDGAGWIAGEEKLGKTYFALDEALALALGQAVSGRFAVPERRRVSFIEEEDSPRRVHRRLPALLRGRGLDPADAQLRHELNAWFRIEVWSGFSLDEPASIDRLDAHCAAFRPAVVYLDVLRKLTRKDLNKADQASALLAPLDALRRKHGVIFRVLHHYRKSQGFRTGRGSQELGGSFVLGAWGECSLFFEPIGRKHGHCRVEVQVKDGPPVPGFKLTFYTEGPSHAPTLVRLTAEHEAEDTSADDVLLQAVAAAPKTEAVVGHPGASVETLVTLLKRSDKTIRRALKRLVDAKLVLVTGQASKRVLLYGVNE